MHVRPRIGVEHLSERVDPVIQALGLGQIVGAQRSKQGRVQIRNDAAATESKPLQPKTRELRSQALWVVSTLTWARQALQSANVPFMFLNVPGPILDGANGWDLLANAQQNPCGYPVRSRAGIGKRIRGRSVTSAIRLIWVTAMSGD